MIVTRRAKKFCKNMADIMTTIVDVGYAEVSPRLTAEFLRREASAQPETSEAAMRAVYDLHRILDERRLRQ